MLVGILNSLVKAGTCSILRVVQNELFHLVLWPFYYYYFNHHNLNQSSMKEGFLDKVKHLAKETENVFSYVNEPGLKLQWWEAKWAAHENMAFFVLHKLILQMCMCSYPMGLDVWFLVGPSSTCTSILHDCKQQRLWQDCTDVQARLSLRWSPMW